MSLQVEKKIDDSSWDFRTANTKENTHCYHNYPAMMIPQVANRLISEYGKNTKYLFDPYCGTGTSLVEASLRGINSIGTDINPLARLIAETKTSIIETQVLDLYLKEFNDFSFSLNFGIKNYNFILPKFKNIDFWFKEEVKEKLAIIKTFINEIKDDKVRKFFLVAFSETVRESSYTRNSEFKLYRMSEKQRTNYNPDVLSIITSKLIRNRRGLRSYLEKVYKKHVKIKIYGFDTSHKVEGIENESIDIIVTSPPYGDSRTTVAYGQFSRLSNQWLDVENANQIDNKLMGGRPREIEHTGIRILDKTIEQICKEDLKRAKDVYSFYFDYRNSISNVSKTLKKGGVACYVVGNRRVKNIELPTDKITKEMFKENNFKYINTFIRAIPNKRMPSRNSPTNEIGKASTTMNNEYIVVMQKC